MLTRRRLEEAATPQVDASNSVANRQRVANMGPLVAAAAFYVAFIVRTGVSTGSSVTYTLFDDSMISMRYARNFAHGAGLVWNPGGAHVEGYSNFLWTLWMAFIHKLPLSSATTSLAVMASGAALLLATAWISGRIAALLAPTWRPAQPVATALVAFSFALVFWTLRGMEVDLLAFLTAAAVYLLVRAHGGTWSRRTVWPAALLLVPALLARDDALILCIVVAAFAVAMSPVGLRRPTAVVFAMAVTATVAGHEIFRQVFYGNLLPNTYYLKVAGNPVGHRLERGLVAFAVQLVCGLAVPGMLAWLALRRARAQRMALWLLAALVVGQVAYSVSVGGDAWEEFLFADRYLATALPFLAILATLGLASLVNEGLDDRARALWLGVAAAVILAAMGEVLPLDVIQATPPQWPDVRVQALLGGGAIILLASLRNRSVVTRRRSTWIGAAAVLTCGAGFLGATWIRSNATYVNTYDQAHVRYALALQAATRSTAVIAVGGAGAVPYFSERPAVDLLGKSDAVIAHEAVRTLDVPPGHAKWDYAYSVCTLRPDLVAELWHATAADRATIAACGYTNLTGLDVYVRNDSGAVDRVALSQLIRGMLHDDPADFAYLVRPSTP